MADALSVPMPANIKASLVGIPAEIRLIIYHLLFAHLVDVFRPLHILTAQRPPTQILRACKLISTEATPIFWALPLRIDNHLRRFMRNTGVSRQQIAADHRWDLLKHVTISIHHMNPTRIREIKRMRGLQTLTIDMDHWTYIGPTFRLKAGYSIRSIWERIWRYGVMTWPLDKEFASLMAAKPNMTLYLANEMRLDGDEDSQLPGITDIGLRWGIRLDDLDPPSSTNGPPYDIMHFR